MNAITGWICALGAALALVFDQEWYFLWTNIFFMVANFYYAGYFTKE